MSIRVAAAALSLVLFALTGCGGPPGWELRVDAEPGERFVLETISDVDMSMDLGPMGNQEVTNVMTMVMALEPLEATDAETRFAFGLDRIAVVVRFAETSMEYDTEGDNTDSPLSPLEGYFRAVLDAEMEATLSSRGEVLAITGADEISSATDYIQDPALQQLAAQLTDSFNGDALTAALQQSSPQYPENRVDVGDTWDQTLSVPNPMGTLTVVTTYTVAGEEEHAGLKCLKLDVDQTMTPEGESPVLTQLRQMAAASGGGVELRLGEMSGKGSVWVEIDTGMMAGGDLDSVLMADFDLTGVPGPTGQPVDLTMKMALNGNSKVNRVH